MNEGFLCLILICMKNIGNKRDIGQDESEVKRVRDYTERCTLSSVIPHDL